MSETTKESAGDESSSSLLLKRILNVHDFQVVAKEKIPSKALYEYIASGSDDEQTLQQNRAALKLWYLRPRVLRPVARISLVPPRRNCGSLFFDQHGDCMMKAPLFACPAGVQCLVNPDGECATARACAKEGILFVHSQHATKSIEEVTAATPSTMLKWYQLYILKDRELTKSLLHRAVQAGYKGIFLTVDSPRLGFREADARNGFDALPPPFRLANYPTSKEKTYNKREHSAWDQNSEQLFDQNYSWDIIGWIKSYCPLPVIVKGIHTSEDACLAVEAGADGVMVSNHGGRQLDGVLPTIDILPEVVKAVGGRIPVLVDGGFQRGTDILKALSLGATAVGIGKPIFFALAVGGETGVRRLFQLLKQELEAAMALCGCSSISEITPDITTRHPSGAPVVKYERSML